MKGPYRSRRWFFVFGRYSGEFDFHKVRRAWGIYWSGGGFIGVLLTEKEESK